MAFCYAAAGLRLAANERLPYLPSAASSSSPDLTIHVRQRPAWAPDPGELIYASAHTDAHGVPMLRVTRGIHGFCFNYVDDCLCWIDASGSTLWLTYRSTLEDACTYLVGPVLSLALRVRGDFALHASAVTVRGGVIAFAGPHGAGKSTMAAALGGLGFPVMTDDILRLTRSGDTWWAHPLGGILRLWPESASVIAGCDRLERITPNWNKRALAIGNGGLPAATAVAPLSGIVFLTCVDAAVAPSLTAVSPAEAAVRLAANSSAAHLLDAPARAHEFHQVAAIAARVPCAVLVRRAQSSLDDGVSVVRSWIDSLAPVTTT